jgi:hypothetical protein
MVWVMCISTVRKAITTDASFENVPELLALANDGVKVMDLEYDGSEIGKALGGKIHSEQAETIFLKPFYFCAYTLTIILTTINQSSTSTAKLPTQFH